MFYKLQSFLNGKKTFIGITAGVIYSILIYIHQVPNNQMVWTAIGGWTGVSFRLAQTKV